MAPLTDDARAMEQNRRFRSGLRPAIEIGTMAEAICTGSGITLEMAGIRIRAGR